VAEPVAPDTAQALAIASQAAPVDSVRNLKLPAKPIALRAVQSPDLAAANTKAPVSRPDTQGVPAVAARKQDTRGAAREAAPKNDKAAQTVAVPVAVNIPVPIAPKLPAGMFLGGASGEAKPAGTAPVPDTHQPVEDQAAPIVLQPKPMLEVKIHFNQSEAPATAASNHQPMTASARPAPAAFSPIGASPVVRPAAHSMPQAATVRPNGSAAAKPVAGTVFAASGSSGSSATSNQQGGEAAPGNQQADKNAPAASRTPAAPEPPVDAPAADVLRPVDAAHPIAAPHPIVETVPAQPIVHRSGAAAAAVSATATVSIPAIPAHTAPASIPIPASTPAPSAARDAKPEPPPLGALLREQSATEQPKAPLRSLSLEFTPDGANDIKVRLSERGGDVHISLHGTDASLAGRMREGVGDLVGSLSKAGYDAQAWTPDQGRQNQRQEPEQRKAPRNPSGGDNAEEFSGILQQPIQEIL
jgi:hypothetical protein